HIEEFVGANNLSLATSDPIVKAAFLCLSQAWPRTLSFDQLLNQSRRQLDAQQQTAQHGATPEVGFILAKALLTAYAGGSDNLIELWLRPPTFATTVSDRPVASPLARLQATSGAVVSSLRHQTVTLNEFDRQLLPYLDGSRTRSAMLKVLLEHFRR